MSSSTLYNSSDKVQRCRVLELIEEFAEDLMAMSGQCMDIGCGPGDITKDILMPVLPPDTTILGTDISKDMISYANKVYADNVRLTFDTLDIQTKSLPEKYLAGFHHIFSFHTLHWCNDIKQAFNNIFRMLRPGGSMLVLLVASHDIFDIFKLLALDNHYASYIPDTTKLFSPMCLTGNFQKELKNLLINTGFKIHHCSHRQVVSEDKDQSKFLSSIMSCTLLPHEMPQELVTQFWEDVKCEYMKRKICYEEVKNNVKQTVILDLYKILIVYASK